MRRRAVLVAAPGKRPNLAPGTMVDLLEWRRYLASSHGGAWEDGEIESLVHPSSKQLEDALAKAEECDFAFVAFSGHGMMAMFDGEPTTFLQVSSHGQPVPYFDLRPKAARTLMVIDSCRWDPSGRLGLMRKASSESLQESALASIVRKAYRDRYEELILKTERGVITAFGCGCGEEAGDRYSEAQPGGLYTLSMIACADAWHEAASRSQALNILEAHEVASAKVSSKNGEQHPRIHQGRRLGIFPFAVKP